MQLRPYQQEAVNAIIDHWNEWQRELLVLPTGCGKTVVFNTVAHGRPGNVLILAHRDELIEQARDKYYKMFSEPAGKIKASETNLQRVTVGSVQTMMRRDYTGLFNTVIVDEAHHSISDSYQAVLGQFPEARVLGVTATPDRGDKKSLARYYDGIAYEYGLKQAVSEGYLCNITARTVPLEIDMSDVKVSCGDFQVDSVAETLEPYLPKIAEAIELYASARKTVVFCPLISIAQELADMIPGAREVNGMSPDRKETLEWFDQAGPGSVLCNAMLLTEGWDCPSVDCVVVLRPTKIRSLYAQMIGRGTRLAPGKENLLILDFLWLCKKHNLCKPANLIADDEEIINVVAKATEEEEIDLFDALSDAEEQRRSALAAELARQQKKKSKLLNPLDVFTILDDVDLLDYEPIFQWETAEATEAQVKALEKFGLDAEGVTKGYACKMLDKMIQRANEGKATIRQINALRRHGYDPAEWSFEQASRKLNQLAAVGWQRWRLHE
jgi:superfamily II DNA or RNA helicase